MIQLWGRASSYNVQKVLWTLGELGLAFEHIDAGGRAGGVDTPSFRAMNPNGRVPVLKDGELTIWESQAIVRYLAAQYGSGTLWPEAPAARSHADRWMDWSQAQLQPAVLGLFWALVRTPPAQRDARRIAALTRDSARLYELLDTELSERSFLAGAYFTMADVPAGTSLYRYFAMEIERPDLPNVARWYERLQKRAAFRAGVMIPFDDLFGRLDF